MESNNCNCCQSPLCQRCGKCHNPLCIGKEFCIAIFTEEGLTPEEVKHKAIENHLKTFINQTSQYCSGGYEIKMPLQEAPKDKTNKPSWWLFPYEEAEEVRKVFEHGATKYHAPFTYRQGTGVPLNDLWDATKRHLLELHTNGHYHYDTESQCLTWAHVAANALMAIAAINLKQGK